MGFLCLFFCLLYLLFFSCSSQSLSLLWNLIILVHRFSIIPSLILFCFVSLVYILIYVYSEYAAGGEVIDHIAKQEHLSEKEVCFGGAWFYMRFWYYFPLTIISFVLCIYDCLGEAFLSWNCFCHWSLSFKWSITSRFEIGKHFTFVWETYFDYWFRSRP